MSSILKALKKLEAEKSLLDSEKQVNVSREILQPQAERRNSARWLWLISISATAVIIILTIALFRKSSTHEEAKAPLLPAISRLDTSQALPLPAPILQPVKNDDKKTGIAPPATLKTLNQDQPKPPSKPPVNRSLTVTELPNTPIPAIELPKTESSAKAAPPPRTTATNNPALTLSGIAWNKDSSDRLAIINGQPTATGAVVNGAIVEEILPDKVRMNLSGRTFELFLGSQPKTN